MQANIRYKVLAKKKGYASQVVMDYVGFPSTPTLMKYLDEKEDISAATCDLLFVHETDLTGTVRETYAWDVKGGQGKPRLRASHPPLLEHKKEPDSCSGPSCEIEPADSRAAGDWYSYKLRPA
jgi:hypothetical protein